MQNFFLGVFKTEQRQGGAQEDNVKKISLVILRYSKLICSHCRWPLPRSTNRMNSVRTVPPCV